MNHPQYNPTPNSAFRLARAYDRGDSDAYYRRGRDPHLWLDWGSASRVEPADMTPEELAEYDRGFRDNLSGEKDWGYE